MEYSRGYHGHHERKDKARKDMTRKNRAKGHEEDMNYSNENGLTEISMDEVSERRQVQG